MRSIRIAGAMLALGALVTACGSDGKAATPSTTAPASTTTVAAGDDAFPVTVQAANGAVTIAARPQRIVSLAPTATESLFAIGAGSQVVAVDNNSTYPADAPVTDLSGYDPNLEAVAAHTPDLVVVSDDINGIVDGLNRLGIPVLQQPAAKELDDVYAEIEQLGAATGHIADAAAVVGEMRQKIDAIVAGVGTPQRPLTYYHELDSTYYSVTSATFIGRLYSLVGLTNIADAAGVDTAGGYPQLSPEFIIDADPDLIFLADAKCCQQDAATVAARPGWGALKAVHDDGVISLDDDVASRWGPRVVDLLDSIAKAVHAVPVG